MEGDISQELICLQKKLIKPLPKISLLKIKELDSFIRDG